MAYNLGKDLFFIRLFYIFFNKLEESFLIQPLLSITACSTSATTSNYPLLLTS